MKNLFRLFILAAICFVTLTPNTGEAFFAPMPGPVGFNGAPVGFGTTTNVTNVTQVRVQNVIVGSHGFNQGFMPPYPYPYPPRPYYRRHRRHRNFSLQISFGFGFGFGGHF